MKLLLISLLSVAALLGGLTAYAKNDAAVAPAKKAADAEWLIDFKAAQAKAKAENKPMLLDFTGSDWCVWCVRLTQEVFSKEAFKAYAAESLVLVELDFPSRKPQSEVTKLQNEALAQKYGIRGFPTIVLLSPEGELIGRTGYQRGGPEKYIEHLKEILGEK